MVQPNTLRALQTQRLRPTLNEVIDDLPTRYPTLASIGYMIHAALWLLGVLFLFLMSMMLFAVLAVFTSGLHQWY